MYPSFLAPTSQVEVLFNLVFDACEANTKLNGGGGAWDVGVWGTLRRQDAFMVVHTLLTLVPLPEGVIPTLVDVGAGDGRVLLLAAVLFQHLYPNAWLRLVGVELNRSAIEGGYALGEPELRVGNQFYSARVMAKVGDRDPLPAWARIEWRLGVVEAKHLYKYGTGRGKSDVPRVDGLQGATYVLVVWEGWNTDDKEEFFRLCHEARSVLVICVVQKKPTGQDEPIQHIADRWGLKIAGEVKKVFLVGHTTTLYTWFLVNKKETAAAAKATGSQLGGVLPWEDWRPRKQMQTRCRVSAWYAVNVCEGMCTFVLCNSGVYKVTLSYIRSQAKAGQSAPGQQPRKAAAAGPGQLGKRKSEMSAEAAEALKAKRAKATNVANQASVACAMYIVFACTCVVVSSKVGRMLTPYPTALHRVTGAWCSCRPRNAL